MPVTIFWKYNLLYYGIIFNVFNVLVVANKIIKCISRGVHLVFLYANNVGHLFRICRVTASAIQLAKRIPVAINIAFVCSTIFTLRSVSLCFSVGLRIWALCILHFPWPCSMGMWMSKGRSCTIMPSLYSDSTGLVVGGWVLVAAAVLCWLSTLREFS